MAASIGLRSKPALFAEVVRSRAARNHYLKQLHLVGILDDADQCSGASGACRSPVRGWSRSWFRDDGDHSFRDDPDQLITIAVPTIVMPGNVFHRARWRWTSE